MAAVRPEDLLDLASPVSSGVWKGVPHPQPARPKPAFGTEADYEAFLEQEMLKQARIALAAKNARITSELPKSFSMQIDLQHPKSLAQEAVNFTIATMNGLLMIETVAGPLPRPPLSNLRDAVNRINMCSGGSTFTLRTCGMVARYCLFPRLMLETGINGDSVLRAVRQINYDRVVAQAFFQEEWLRSGLLRTNAIEKACSVPLAASISSVISFPQLKALLDASAISSQLFGDRLCVMNARQNADPTVWLTVGGGVLRGWCVPGSLQGLPVSPAQSGVLGKLIGRKKTEGATLSRQQLDKQLDRINSCNETNGLIEYTWDGTRTVAMAIFPPTEKRMEVEELKAFVETLIACAREGPEKELTMQAGA